MSDRPRQANESTSLKQEQNPGYGGSPSIASVEGLTPSGLFINVVQWFLIGLWLTGSFLPHLAALIVGFENADIGCDRFGFIHPLSYLRITGVAGIFTSTLLTVGVYYNYMHNPLTMELSVNGRMLEFPNKNVIFVKLIALTMSLGSSIWCIVGWIIVHDLNMNKCGNDLVEQTILGWTISQIMCMTCAILSRYARERPKLKIHIQADQEGSVQHD